jgi:rubrerythrin
VVEEDALTYYEFFKRAEQVELLSRQVYQALADHPATPPGVRELFSGLADEEEEHARRIQLLATTLRGSSWSNQIVKQSEGGIEAAAREYEALLVEVTTRRQPGDLMRLLDRLVQMEDRLSFVHAEELAAGAGPAAARLFEAMAKQDRRHRKLLERARRVESAA